MRFPDPVEVFPNVLYMGCRHRPPGSARPVPGAEGETEHCLDHFCLIEAFDASNLAERAARPERPGRAALSAQDRLNAAGVSLAQGETVAMRSAFDSIRSDMVAAVDRIAAAAGKTGKNTGSGPDVIALTMSEPGTSEEAPVSGLARPPLQ